MAEPAPLAFPAPPLPPVVVPPPSSQPTVQLSGPYEPSLHVHCYKIEYGTGIRECKGPQPCNGSLIGSGDLQIAVWWGDCPWGPRWVYRHWRCMTPTVFKNMHDKIGHRVEDLQGFSSLSSSDQAQVRQAFDAGRPTGISRLNATEIKSLLKRAGIKQSGDKGMITERATGFFNAAGLSLEGTLDDLRDRIDGYAALASKGMLPTPEGGADVGEGSSATGAMQSEIKIDPHQPDVKMEVGGSAMMDLEVDEKKPQLNSDTEDEELDEKKPHIKSDPDEDETFGKPMKKRKRTTMKPAKPRVKKEPVKRKIVAKPLPPPSTQPTRRSRRLNQPQLDENGIDIDAPGEAGPSSLPFVDHNASNSPVDIKQEVTAKIEHHEEEGLVSLGIDEGPYEAENVAPKVEGVEEGLVSAETEEAGAAAEGRPDQE